MLVLVLLVVLVAAGVLVAAVIGGHPEWAWISVALSGLAAVLLGAERLLRRRRVRRPEPEESPDGRPQGAWADADAPPISEPAAPPPGGSTVNWFEKPTGLEDAEPPPEEQPERPEPESAPQEEARSGQADAQPDQEAEPEQERTAARDLLVLSDISAEVVVVDEHPRYHVTGCGWLGNRQTIPLPLQEARDLGFTPCARCQPNSVLAARHRAGG